MDQIFNFPANLVLTINQTNKPFQQQEVNSFSLFSIQFIIFSFMNVDPHLGTGDSRNTDVDTGSRWYMVLKELRVWISVLLVLVEVLKLLAS